MARAIFHYGGNRTLPSMSYDQAMRLRLDGVQLKDCSSVNFSAAVERLVESAANPQMVRDELIGHDYQYRTDVWHCLLVLLQHRVPFEQVFKNPPE
jgi:hypothetical protein